MIVKNSPVRDNIVNTAGDLFLTQGYKSTGINEIISKANIAKATLYHHFNSKADICQAFLLAEHGKFMDNLMQFVASRGNSKNKILGVFDYLMDLFRRNEYNGCWGFTVMGEIPASENKILEQIQSHKEDFKAFWSNW